MWKFFISLAPLKLCSQDQSNQILYQCTVQDELCTPNGFLSRESSAEPDRPASQLSGAGKRKNSPKFHFLKNRRKPVQPARREPGTPDPQQRDGGGTPTEQQREAGTPGEQFRGEGNVELENRFKNKFNRKFDVCPSCAALGIHVNLRESMSFLCPLRLLGSRWAMGLLDFEITLSSPASWLQRVCWDTT